MSKIRHVLGISGGKDSAALAIYMRKNHPEIDLEYYFCDTGKELDETYELIKNLEVYLGKKVTRLESKESVQAGENPFDFYYKAFRGYLPSSQARWCTKKMKLEPFEEFVGDTPVVSYVGIRGDEDREGYISKKTNIQSIFPFRKNIWSEDVITKVLDNSNIQVLSDLYRKQLNGTALNKVITLIEQPYEVDKYYKEITAKNQKQKLNKLLDAGIATFNQIVFAFLKSTNYPLAVEEDYSLLRSEDVLVRADIFRILEESGVGIPGYYHKKEYEVDGKKGEYARSRSGCYFCFFQQKIEWIWLYEQHPELFKKAMVYENEKEGFTWSQGESLRDLTNPLRMEQIKKDHLRRDGKEKSAKSNFLIDILDNTEDTGCTACFI